MPAFLFMTDLQNILSNHIMILDGAMGTMVQSRELTENDFRGDTIGN